MSSSVQNIPAVARIYPYVTPAQPGESSDVASALVPIPIPPAKEQPPSSGTGTGKPPTGELEWEKFSLSVPKVDGVTKAIGKVTDSLQKLIGILSPILDIIQLFLNTFNSFTMAFKALFAMMDRLLDKIAESTKSTAGVYMNIIVPPALLKVNQSNFTTLKLSNGGYQGFLGRLQASFYDVTDIQRPPFIDQDTVGGFILMVDANSAQSFFTTLNQLSNIFDLTKLFGFDVAPPPPKNVKGTPGFYQDGGSLKYGIKVEWDGAPYLPVGYALFRSTKPGGESGEVNYHPTKLTGKDGLFSTVNNAIAHGTPWPKVTVKKYQDSTFNGGKAAYVPPSKPDGGGVYIDTDVPNKAISLKDPPSAEALPYTPPNYYYVVRSTMGPLVGTPDAIDQGWLPFIGPRSKEAKVAVKFCDDSADSAIVIEHKNGVFELLAPGFGGFGKWTSIQATAIMPFLPDLISMIRGMLKNLSGMATNASDSFAKFIKQIKEKIMLYINTINLINQLLEELQNFTITGSAAFLYVPPKTGGLNGFMKRVKEAQIPPAPSDSTSATQGSFSGPTGITMGVVMMIGMSSLEQDKVEINNQFQAVVKAWDAMTAILGKK